MEINKGKIRKRFEEIREAQEQIEQISSLEEEEFLNNKEHIAAVKYYLIQAIESINSICLHIAARKYQKGVSNPGDCFELLRDKGVISKGLSKRLSQMSRFRNILVHQYWEIKDKKVLEYIRGNLGDFNQFIEAIGDELNI